MAAFLSFVLPGLGQMWTGHHLRGVLLAIPQIVILGLGAGLAVRSALYFGGLLIQYALGIAILNLALLALRAFAVFDAYRVARLTSPAEDRRAVTPMARAVVSVLLVLTVGIHGVLAYGSYLTHDLTASVFGREAPSGQNGGELPVRGRATPTPDATQGGGLAGPGGPVVPSGSPEPGGPTPGTASPGAESLPPELTPAPGTPYWAENGRLDLLLIGGDAGPGRFGLRTDTMVVLSVDVATSRAAMFSLPRNLINVPLPEESAGSNPCRCFPGLLNALYVEAGQRPDAFPGGDNRGFRAVAGAIEELMQIRLDGLVVVDLNGFIGVIDALGGIDVNVKKALFDPRYPQEDGSGHRVVDIKPGLQHMDGQRALEYARSRNQDSDYARIARQQAVLLALRRKLDACNILPRLPQLLDSTKDLVRTDVPLEELPGLLELGGSVEINEISRFAFTPFQGIDDDVSQGGGVAKIRDIVARGFEPQERGVEEPGGSGGGGC